MNEALSSGLALICDDQGMILQVLRDDLKLIPVGDEGMLFFRLVDTASRMKAMNFLTEIKSQGAVLDWELNIQTEDKIITFYFAGGKVGSSLLITAATNSLIATRLYDDMLQINNEQTNLLRAALKDLSDRDNNRTENKLYDEISLLNNELVSIQRELARKNAELSHLNEVKNQFLGMAAHDLRNPLHVISTYSEFLLDDLSSKLDSEQFDFLTTIHDQSQFMARLINDLLDVATIESGKLQLDLQPVDLIKLTENNLVRNRMIAARKEITLILDTSPVLPLLLDPTKIEQVLDNLITNAIKFSPPGSQVFIRIQPAKKEILLTVQDEGPGIPADEVEKLFKPFQRTSVKSTAGEKSTGLGLAIIKRIVEGHGGQIWLKSQVGTGSTFFVSLPIIGSEDL